MERIAAYTGRMLNHVEALYRPGERALAVELAEALGCAVSDTGFVSDAGTTFLAVHPEPDDRDPRNNVFYISEMTAEQRAVEARLRTLAEEDAAFAADLARYRHKARSRPFGVPHFALRYPDAHAVEQVAERIAGSLEPRLKDRIDVRIFRPGDRDGAGGTLTQGFVHQDVIVSGAFLLGQLIELQTQPH